MTMYEIIREEWERLSLIGRIVWFPWFVILICFTISALLVCAPLLVLLYLIERLLGRGARVAAAKVRKTVYKKEYLDD